LIAIPYGAHVEFIEVKTQTGKLSKLQQYRRKELLEHGLIVEVYRG